MSKTREKCTIDKRETVAEKGGYGTLDKGRDEEEEEEEEEKY